MRYPIKKLFHGYASVRDYKVKECIKNMEELVLIYKNETMTIPLKDLSNPLQFVKNKMKSKFGGADYTLYDFKWKNDKMDVNEKEDPRPTKKKTLADIQQVDQAERQGDLFHL